MGDPTQTSAWKALRAHYDDVADLQMRDLFRDDPRRASRLSWTLGDLLFDYSKNRVTDETLTMRREETFTTLSIWAADSAFAESRQCNIPAQG